MLTEIPLFLPEMYGIDFELDLLHLTLSLHFSGDFQVINAKIVKCHILFNQNSLQKLNNKFLHYILFVYLL